MKNKYTNNYTRVFVFQKIMATFEAFYWNFSSSQNPEIVRSEREYLHKIGIVENWLKIYHAHA